MIVKPARIIRSAKDKLSGVGVDVNRIEWIIIDADFRQPLRVYIYADDEWYLLTDTGQSSGDRFVQYLATLDVVDMDDGIQRVVIDAPVDDVITTYIQRIGGGHPDGVEFDGCEFEVQVNPHRDPPDERKPSMALLVEVLDLLRA